MSPRNGDMVPNAADVTNEEDERRLLLSVTNGGSYSSMSWCKDGDKRITTSSSACTDFAGPPRQNENCGDEIVSCSKDDDVDDGNNKNKLQFLPPFYFNIFFACASFSIIMPSIAPYIFRMDAPLSFLPWVVSIYAAGEVVGSVLFGCYYEWSVKSNTIQSIFGIGGGPRTSLAGCIMVGLFGSVMYASADWVNTTYGPWLVFWGRFVQGIWTGGQQTIEQAYLAGSVPSSRRVELTATLSSFAVLGFVVGPSLGAAFTGVDLNVWGLRVDQYNAPGVFTFVILTFMLLQTICFFDGKEDRTQYETEKDTESTSEVDFESGNGVNERERVESSSISSNSNNRGFNYVGVYACLFLFFVHYYSFAVQETVTTPLVMHLYGWDSLQVNLLFVGAGILSLAASVAIRYLSRIVDDRSMLLFSVVLGLVGSVLLVDNPWKILPSTTYGDGGSGTAVLSSTAVDNLNSNAGSGGGGFGDPSSSAIPLHRFILGFSLITIAFPFGRNVTLGVFSNVLGPTNQGRWMGLMLALGAVPRVLGPFSAILALEVVQWLTWLEFGSIAILFLIALAAVFASYRKLVTFSSEITDVGG